MKTVMQQTTKQHHATLKTHHSQPVLRNIPNRHSNMEIEITNQKKKISELLEHFDNDYEKDYFPEPMQKHYLDPRKSLSCGNENTVFEDRLKELRRLEQYTISDEHRDSLCKNYRKRRAKTSKVMRQTIKPHHGILKTNSEPILRSLPDLKEKPKKKPTSLHSKNDNDTVFRVKNERRGQSDIKSNQSDSRNIKDIRSNCRIDEKTFSQQLSVTERTLFRVKVSEGKCFSSNHTDDVIISRERVKSACVENRYKASTFYKPNQDQNRLQTPAPPPRRSSLDLTRTKSFSKYKPAKEDYEKLRLLSRHKTSQSGTRNISLDQPDNSFENLSQLDFSINKADQSDSTITRVENSKPRKIILKRTNIPLKYYMQFVTKGPGKLAVR